MSNYGVLFLLLVILLLMLWRWQKRRSKAAVIHRLHSKGKGKTEMKELAKRFIGKKCMVFTVVPLPPW